jgi:hypothetical protein
MAAVLAPADLAPGHTEAGIVTPKFKPHDLQVFSKATTGIEPV